MKDNRMFNFLKRYKKPKILSPEDLFKRDIKEHFAPIVKSVDNWLTFYGVNNESVHGGVSTSWTKGGDLRYRSRSIQGKSHHNIPYVGISLDVSTEKNTQLNTSVLFIDNQFNKSDLSEFSEYKIVFYDPKNPQKSLTDDLLFEIKEVLASSFARRVEDVTNIQYDNNKHRIADRETVLTGYLNDPQFDPEEYFTRKQIFLARPKLNKQPTSQPRLETASIDLEQAIKSIQSQQDKLTSNPEFNDIVQFGFDLKNQILATEKNINEWQKHKLAIPPAFAMHTEMTASFRNLDTILKMMSEAQQAAASKNLDGAMHITKKIIRQMDKWDGIIQEHKNEVKLINDGTSPKLMITHQQIESDGGTMVVAKLKPNA